MKTLPYTARALEMRRNGNRSSLCLCAGPDAWETAKWLQDRSHADPHPVICFPPDTDPSDVDWTPIGRFNTVALHCYGLKKAQIETIAAYCLHAGCKRVHACDIERIEWNYTAEYTT